MKLLRVLNEISTIATIAITVICVYDFATNQVDVATYILMGCIVYNVITINGAKKMLRGDK